MGNTMTTRQRVIDHALPLAIEAGWLADLIVDG